MSHDIDIVNSIQEYLAANFVDASIEQWEHEKQDSINFNVSENATTYILRVMNESIEGLDESEVKTMLENYNVAQVMRDIGDFPIVVTKSGPIFGSP